MVPSALRRYQEELTGLHLLGGAPGRWAAHKPGAAAIVNHNRDSVLDWRSFERLTSGLAVKLLQLGFRKGDFLAAWLPFLTEHVLLEYACFKIGVIHAPLDLRLRPPEVLRSLRQIDARGFAFLGRTASVDFREVGAEARRDCPSVEHLIQVSPPAETIDGALSFPALLADAEGLSLEGLESVPDVRPEDPAQVIFTTGSTGSPKPALLSHRNITCQNFCLGTAFGFGEDTRLLVNLPPSHVGGQAEALMTTLFWGGTAVLLETFDPVRSLDAIQRHGVNIVGQIPAMYNYQWRQPSYGGFRLASLQLAIYGGQQVPRQFLEKLSRMAPGIATGLGLTEAAGFCTYTRLGAGVSELVASLGHGAEPYPMTIRRPMLVDGRAGEVLSDGEVGCVCFTGPQTFLGYVNDPLATAQAISCDGVLYTGDMGFQDEAGLHFRGRAKWIIKPAGHQVYPGDVESHFCTLEEKTASCAAVGVEHPLLAEAIILFVEKKSGAELEVAELRRHARGMASYMRPLHYVLLEPGAMPLNRAAKSDYVQLQAMARVEASKLGWLSET